MNLISEKFGNHIRIRVCGICLKDDNSILLVEHKGLGKPGEFWSPPGGELKFGESIHQALIREFKEETNLDIKVLNFMAINEFYNDPLHAIELFFMVEEAGGKLKTGIDPELDLHQQIINEVKFVTFEELKKLPDQKKHNLLHGKMNSSDLLNMKSYFKLWQ